MTVEQAFVGIHEDWDGQGLTEEERLQRIDELGLQLDDSWCVLQPYSANFNQKPGQNKALLENLTENRVIARTSGLWSPGQTITFGFSGASSQVQQAIQQFLTQYAQPHMSMNLKFTSGQDADVVFDIVALSGAGGYSQIGKQSKGQKVTLSSSIMANASSSGSSSGFNFPRYLCLHECGHLWGLYHEFDKQQCGKGGIQCSGADPKSVMNYPAGSSGGAANAVPSAQTMDNYSPDDIKWLETVYKGGGLGKSGTPTLLPVTIPPTISNKPSQRPPPTQPQIIRPSPPPTQPPPTQQPTTTTKPQVNQSTTQMIQPTQTTQPPTILETTTPAATKKAKMWWPIYVIVFITVITIILIIFTATREKTV